ncbi:hypothetical protein BGZ63DRAFT_423244 [Mariannaea sp. PMI_226]|nr:hypothetical protein BGZ63DRAFT_423244 [Mariannaea sp. PMI_226]
MKFSMLLPVFFSIALALPTDATTKGEHAPVYPRDASFHDGSLVYVAPSHHSCLVTLASGVTLDVKCTDGDWNEFYPTCSAWCDDQYCYGASCNWLYGNPTMVDA